jgi:hypothetical protein
MFRGLINNAKSAAGNLVAKYLARVSVAVPFVVAGGFALAALTAWLTERYGAVTAYWSMAGVLVALGVLASLLVSAKENREDAADLEGEKADTSATMSAATADALAQAPLAALGAVFAVPGGPATALSAARLVGRNWPLAVLIFLIGALFYPAKRTAEGEASVDFDGMYAPKPNGVDRASP